MARRALVEVLAKQRPDLADPAAAIVAGEVQVDGAIVTNANSQVRTDARIVVKAAKTLKGQDKLAAGVDALGGFDFEGRIALDLGASTGGFTTEMLRRGAAPTNYGPRPPESSPPRRRSRTSPPASHRRWGWCASGRYRR